MADLIDITAVQKKCKNCEFWKPIVCFRVGKKNMPGESKACKHFKEKVKKK